MTAPKDGEQLRECINSGQVSAAQVVAHAESGETCIPTPAQALAEMVARASALSIDARLCAIAQPSPQVVAHAEAGDVNFKPLCKRCEDIGECTPRGIESCQIPREVTGWPAGMLQDDSKGLSKALSRDPNARALVREAIQATAEGDDYDKFLVLENDEFDKFWDGMESDFKDAISLLPPKVIGFLGWLKRAKQEAAKQEEVARLREALTQGEALINGDLTGLEWKVECRKFLVAARAALGLYQGEKHE